jgi:hypothetical protein
MGVYGYDNGGHTTYQKPQCPVPGIALIIGGTEVYGGRKFYETDFFNFDLIVRINEGTPEPFPKPVFYNKEAEGLIPAELLQVKLPPMMHLNWPDFSIPTAIDKAWWERLYAFLAEKGVEAQKRKEKYRAIFYCVGGKGRTGTALSILAGLHFSKKFKKKKGAKDFDPVQFIRKTYCEGAVESNEQIEYIEAMTGFEVKELSSTELDYKYKQTTAHSQTSDATNTSAWEEHPGPINDTHYVTIDDNGYVYVNGRLYTGKDVDTIAKERLDGTQEAVFGRHRVIDKDIAVIKGAHYNTKLIGQYKKPAANGNATPDYNGPAHRMPIGG